MHCPVCGHDCVTDARTIFAELPGRFAPCPDCMGLVYDKRSAPPDIDTAEPCPSCGKRFIDEVFAHIYRVMAAEGDLAGTEPLAAAGMPLVHPGFAMRSAPYLPPGSLVLLSRSAGKRAAARLVAEVPEVRGVVRTGAGAPGISDTDAEPAGHTLLAGCDVRADVFPTRVGPIVVYKQQSALHVEFPRDRDEKILSLEREIDRHRPRTFVDACSGAGTLGIAAARAGVPRVIANDAWYAAAFWTACNIAVNREFLGVGEVAMHVSYDGLRRRPVARDPVRVASAAGAQEIEVYQGDLRLLSAVLPPGIDLAALDLFEKNDGRKVEEITGAWRARVGGAIFIP
ncbi:hypothetical protein L21_0767 [Methanoculleus chikugoensis]|uniref:Methyltransferase n=1 Tax=Methanoculleus chikugoensis TaxID=118126 RepID=A0A1M4MJ21_9EURY|nr:hypothetical protein [Methanoculleus chikugoensis]SCL74883.1 hypothetical protein L21_0767 [Methanoculleus chikugoensis]